MVFGALLKRMAALGAMCACLIGLPVATAGQTVIVGGYEFEPFVNDSNGISPALVELLNAEQADYRFEFVRIPAQRRYELMQAGKIDMLFFEMPTWGWQKGGQAFHTTREMLSGHEAFIARRGHWDPATPVEERLRRRMVVTLGYHYAFADFNADQKYLKNRFDVSFAETQGKVLKHLVAGDADIAVVSDLFLMCAIKDDPALADMVMTLPPPDQTYSLPILVRDGAAITPEGMEKLLDRLKATGKLQAFFRSRGIGDFLTY